MVPHLYTEEALKDWDEAEPTCGAVAGEFQAPAGSHQLPRHLGAFVEAPLEVEDVRAEFLTSLVVDSASGAAPTHTL